MFTRSRVALAALASGLAIASPAHAAYGDGETSIGVDDTAPAPGQAILVEACCVGGQDHGSLAFTGAAVGSLVGSGAVLSGCGLVLSRARGRQPARGA
jgi:hypothetical protein